jgi:hypothetical protein
MGLPPQHPYQKDHPPFPSHSLSLVKTDIGPFLHIWIEEVGLGGGHFHRTLTDFNTREVTIPVVEWGRMYLKIAYSQTTLLFPLKHPNHGSHGGLRM